MTSFRIAMLFAFASGILLRLSLPPSHAGTLVFVALSPAIASLLNQRSTSWLAAGSIIGFTVSAHIFLAAGSWEWTLAILPPLIITLRFSLCFYLVGVIANRVGLNWTPVLFPVIWMMLATLFDESLGLPITLAIALAIDFPVLLSPVSLTGTVVFDAFIIFLNSAFAVLSSRAFAVLSRRAFAASLGVVLLFMTSVYIITHIQSDPLGSTADPIRIAIVQPGMSSNELRTSGETLFHRRIRERVLDDLTTSAISAQPDIIIWPEGGNGLYNKRLRHRVTALKEMGAKSSADFLLSGPDLSPDGKQRNALHHLRNGDFIKDAFKSRLVPIVESNLTRGKPTVFNTLSGNVGVAICYDILFSTHMNAVKDQGAEIVVVSSNDSSFENTSLPLWHSSYAIVRGIEYQTTIVFASNNGPTFWSDSSGRIREPRWINDEPSVNYLAVERANKNTQQKVVIYLVSIAYGLTAIIATYGLFKLRAGE
jgi:apolipoprotein N-acyltransferase